MAKKESAPEGPWGYFWLGLLVAGFGGLVIGYAHDLTPLGWALLGVGVATTTVGSVAAGVVVAVTRMDYLKGR